MTDTLKSLHDAVHRNGPPVSVDAAPDHYVRRAVELNIILTRYADWLAAHEGSSAEHAAGELKDLLTTDRISITEQATSELGKIATYYQTAVPLDAVRDELRRHKRSFWMDLVVSFLGALLAPLLVYLLIFVLNVAKSNVSASQFFDFDAVLRGGTNGSGSTHR